MRRLCLALAAALLMAPSLALASGVCPPGVPPQFKCGGPDMAATTALKPSDYGLAPVFGAAIDLVLDVEFEKVP